MITTLPTQKQMYRALVAKDATFDGLFYAAVRTTGIFCRPTCPAKKPKEANVEFFASTRDALFAGYRPCQRCRPMQWNRGAPDWIAGLLATIERDATRRFTDHDLSAMGLDPVRVRRWFLSEHGLTFHAYQRARRLGLAFTELRNGSEQTFAAYDHGFESLSGFRDAFKRWFGEPPGKARRATQVIVTRILTPLGPMVAGATDDGVCLLEFADRRMLEAQLKRLRSLLQCAIAPGRHAHIDHLERELDAYFRGELQTFTVPLITPGTEFQRAVWANLRKIAYGTTSTYDAQARALDAPQARRAVGLANGMNRIAIVIPCHRVVRSDGTLCGYGGGLWRKRWLLDLEQKRR